MKRLLLGVGLALLLSVNALAGPLCVDPERPENSKPARSGLGGTGEPAVGGIGGTGTPARGGLGGTGNPASGGIGGTGAPLAEETGVGIVGIVTGFASVCVNGLEIHFDNQVAVTENGAPAEAGALAVGHLVSIEAKTTSRGLSARRIAIINAYEGPITHLPRNGKTIEVLGQSITLAADTRISATEGLAVGQMVKVSGLLADNGSLTATRIQLAPELRQASLLGTVTIDAQQARIGGVPLAGVVAPGSMLVKGTWTGSELIPRSVQPDPTFRFAGKIGRLFVEGLSQHVPATGRMRVSGQETITGANTRISGNNRSAEGKEQRVFVEGRVDSDGVLRAERIEIGERAELRGGAEKSGRGDPPPARRTSSVPTAPERIERVERPEKQESSERPGRSEKSERLERQERIERPERIERIERIERAERAERIERIERAERGQRTEKVDRR